MYGEDDYLEQYYEDKNDATYFEPPYVAYEDEEDYYDDYDDSCEEDDSLIYGDLCMCDICTGKAESDYNRNNPNYQDEYEPIGQIVGMLSYDPETDELVPIGTATFE